MKTIRDTTVSNKASIISNW